MGTFITPSIVAKEAIIVLINNLVLGGLVHRAFSQEFAKVGDTIKVRKPATFTAQEWTSADFATRKQAITEQEVVVKLDKLYDVSFEVTDKELSLEVKDFSEQLIQPAMRAHAQAIDALIASHYYTIPYYVAMRTDTEANKLADSAKLRSTLNDNKAPFDSRYAVLSPAAEANYIVVPAFLNAEKRGDTEALREASLGRIFGMDYYMDQNMVNHTKGGLDTADLITLTKSGDVLNLAAQAGGGDTTVKKGDIVTEGSQTFVITEDKTVPEAGVDVAHYPAVTADVAQSTIDNVVDTAGVNNLIFHKNAFALVTAPLARPIGGAMAAVENYNGVSCRVVYDYDLDSKANRVSIDLLCGVKTLTEELAVRLIE